MQMSGAISAATLMTATTGVIECWALSIAGARLVLPIVNVADILGPMPLQRPKRAADWFLGTLTWRGMEVPILSFEALDRMAAPSGFSSIVLLNVLSSGGGFYGLVVQQEPTVIKLRLSGLEDLTDIQDRLGPMDAQAVRWQGEMLLIPDLDAIEKVLLA